ncbi:MAG: alpha/beta hydrolase [Corynebacterium sp.]|uniref:alpha/beta hydrolase n=1 Tax=Corynebacterium sp. TaxID=1720 RepID=UPI0026DB5625|nr:alpha/beta hydrolase [Corynebacterium sp.]MDO4761536.1 alpha/beta hydrolase [Corynebacterium sp.]
MNHNNQHSPLHLSEADWQPDMLGEDFEMLSLDLGPDPDGETDIRTTIVRHLPSSKDGSRPAIIYVHGMTDYFFHRHVAEYFADHGYTVYGVDLRKCGRSRTEGQTWHFISDIDLYNRDLDRIAQLIATQHDSLIFMGHSTGGLIAVEWMDYIRRTNPSLHRKFHAVVLNSPWFDIMAPALVVKAMTPIVNLVGKKRPKTVMRAGNLGTYGTTLHVSHHGEWDFDLHMKPLGGCEKHYGWMRAVVKCQKRLHRHEFDCGVPVLTLCSDKSRLAKPYSPESHVSDTVLDVHQIKKWAPFTAQDVTIIQIPDGMHDLFLSTEPVRNHALDVAANWLNTKCS